MIENNNRELPAFMQGLPTCVLKNTKTGRFHPIVFSPAPMPGLADLKARAPQRYRSLGHHTDGFETVEAAIGYIRENHLAWMDRTLDWSGEDVPAITEFF